MRARTKFVDETGRDAQNARARSRGLTGDLLQLGTRGFPAATPN